MRKQHNFLNFQFADGYCSASSDWAITDKNFCCGKFEITDALKAEKEQEETQETGYKQIKKEYGSWCDLYIANC